MSVVKISTYTQRNGNPFLPKACWYNEKNNLPTPMLIMNGALLQIISGKNIFPDERYNKDRIADEILLKRRISFHAWVDQDGIVEQLVPFPYMAFHAGKSRMFGMDYCAKFMAGIALLSDGEEYSYLMLESLAKYIYYLIKISPHWESSNNPTQQLASYELAIDIWNGTYPMDRVDNVDHGLGYFPWATVRHRVDELLLKGN